MNELRIKNNKAGSISKNPSFTLNLAPTPKSINNANPPADINKKGLNIKPTSKPKPPKISRVAVSVPNFSNPKRMNSLFIFGDEK